MQKNKIRQYTSALELRVWFFLEDVCLLDELSVDSNPKRAKGVRLDKCLLASLSPRGVCEVTVEVTGRRGRIKFNNCSPLL